MALNAFPPVSTADSIEEDVAPYRGMTPEERYGCLLDILRLTDLIWDSLPPEKRAAYSKTLDALDDPGPWWTRIPSVP